jgi:uncharacterized membrane protein
MMQTHRISLRAEMLAVAIAGGLLLVLIAADAALTQPLLGVPRAALGLVMALAVPGYFIQAAAFPRISQIDALERAMLTLVLSIATIPPLALLLEWTPGLQVDLPGIVTALGAACTLVIAIAWRQRARVPQPERCTLALPYRLPGLSAARRLSPVNGLLIVVMLAAGAVALIAMGVLLLGTGPGQHFTEFYVLNPEGLAENLPRAVRAGDAVALRVGVINREGAPVTYRVAFTAGEATLDALPPVTLNDGEARITPVTLALALPAGEQDVLVTLYRDDSPQPYRQLRLRFTITP